MRIIKSVTLQDAKKALDTMEKKAKELSVNACICITDGANNILVLERMDDCKTVSINLSRAKAMTAFNLRDSSRNAGKITREMNAEFSFWAGTCETGFGGGMPLYSDENELLPIGAIGVSGGTQEEDEGIAFSGIKAMGLITK